MHTTHNKKGGFVLITNAHNTHNAQGGGRRPWRDRGRMALLAWTAGDGGAPPGGRLKLCGRTGGTASRRGQRLGEHLTRTASRDSEPRRDKRHRRSERRGMKTRWRLLETRRRRRKEREGERDSFLDCDLKRVLELGNSIEGRGIISKLQNIDVRHT
ncbi:hypothetical protein Syun_011726 [Stephania yunnanensis]|uniref:Uncharacterized protein n=1 Tax=Stephania yunnanensis TaxID=152371 RepID=A0AAP0JY41_9MAGN